MPSLAQIGFAGTGLQCAAAGGGALAVVRHMAQYLRLVTWPKLCVGTAGRPAARFAFAGRWVVGGVAIGGPADEADGRGAWAYLVIASVSGGALVCLVVVGVSWEEGLRGAFASSITTWEALGPVAAVVWVWGIPIEWPSGVPVLPSIVGLVPEEEARVSPGVRSFLAWSQGTCATMYPPFPHRFVLKR